MENSKILLQYALDALTEANICKDLWAVGGGTVLSHYYNHRLSKDIDIFISDSQYLSLLSPRFNNMTENALDYNEMAKYISLTYPEGKVDFIVGGQITSHFPIKSSFFDNMVYIEDPVEIVCKKLFYRGDQILPRDIFDLAVVFDSKRQNDLIEALATIPKEFTVFAKKFSTIKNIPLYSNTYTNMLLETGKHYIGKEVLLCSDLINSLNEKLHKKIQTEVSETLEEENDYQR